MKWFDIDFYIWTLNKKKERVLKYLGTKRVSDFLYPGMSLAGKAFRLVPVEWQNAERIVINKV